MNFRIKEVWQAYKRARPEWLVGAGRVLKKRLSPRAPLIARAMARLSEIAEGIWSSPGNHPAHRSTILFVTHDLGVGGAQQVVKTLASWFLRSTGYDAKFVAMNSGTWRKQFQAIAPVFNLAASIKINGVDRARSKLEAFAGPDIVAVFVNSIASAGFFDHWFRDVPAIAYVHELPKVIDSFGDNIHKVKARTVRVLGGSAAVVDALVARYEIPRSSCGVVHDFIEVVGADTEPGPEARATARRLLDVDPSAFVVMACGVVHWRKSPHLFIDMAERVARQTKQPTRFVWIGDGPDLEECRATVRRRGLGAIVEFIGYRDSVYDYFRAADVFALPSEEDPFPLVCLYAALAEVPIVCFDGAGGIPELVAKGCGIAVPFLDAEAMANAIVEYARQPELKADHGRAGRAIVRAEFTVATAGPKMLATIREVTGLPADGEQVFAP